MARNSILWKFEDQNGTNIQLLGTIHLSSAHIHFMKNELENIIPTVDKVYTETEIEKLSGPEFQAEFVIPKSKRISDYVTERQYLQWKDVILKFTGIDLELFDRLQPMVLQNIIAQGLLKDDKHLSTDEFVYKIARDHNIPTLGLETTEEQIQTFNQIEFDYQLIMLKRFLSDLSGSRKKLKHQIELYKKERIHQLYRNAKNSLGMLKELLLYRRNRIMAERIVGFNSGDKILVAVGAAHLSGEKGILHLCHKMGMTFSPFRTNDEII